MSFTCSKIALALTFVCCVATTLMACGDSELRNGEPMTVAEFEDGYRTFFYRSVCRASMECPEEQRPQLTKRVSRYESLDECERGLPGNGFVDISVPYVTEVEQGITNFDGEWAEACLDALDRRVAANPCEPVQAARPWPEVCQEVFDGQQAEGMPCSADFHCDDGICDTTIDVGDDVCWRGECVPAEPEQVVGEGESCELSTRVCDTEAGLACANSETSSERVCVDLSERTEGASCSAIFGQCAEGLACVGSQCRQLDILQEGDPCTSDGSFCESGQVCVVTQLEDDRPAASECRAPGGLGDTCYRHEECAAGLRCSSRTIIGYSEGTCEPAARAGEECFDELECDIGLTCNVDTCRPYYPRVNACDYGGTLQ